MLQVYQIWSVLFLYLNVTVIIVKSRLLYRQKDGKKPKCQTVQSWKWAFTSSLSDQNV